MDGKSINKPKMDVKIATALAITAVIICATGISLSNEIRSGKTNEGVVWEVLHTTVENGFVGLNDDVDEQVESYYKNLSTNSVYDTVELEKGNTIRFAQGSTVIVTKGRTIAACDDKPLMDITEGSTLADGEEAEHNHLYVIEDGDCGLYARGNADILIKGGYEINTGNKE